jgi:hypothetical protein
VFTVIAVKARAMMKGARILKDKRFKLWSKTVKTVTALENLIPVTLKGETKT